MLGGGDGVLAAFRGAGQRLPVLVVAEARRQQNGHYQNAQNHRKKGDEPPLSPIHIHKGELLLL